MDEMPWIRVRNRIPGRVSFFTWDDAEGMFFLEEAKKAGIKIRLFDAYVRADGTNLVGIFVSGWKKDLKELNQVLFEVDKRLMLTNKAYVELRNNWMAKIGE